MLGCLFGSLVSVAMAGKPERKAKTTQSDRLEITNPAGVVKIVIHSDPKPTIEITDDKGKTDKADLVHLIRLANRFGEEKK